MRGLGHLFEFNFSPRSAQPNPFKVDPDDPSFYSEYFVCQVQQKAIKANKKESSQPLNFNTIIIQPDIFRYGNSKNPLKTANLIEFEDDESIQSKVALIYNSPQKLTSKLTVKNETDKLLIAICNCLMGVSSEYFKYEKSSNAMIMNKTDKIVPSEIFNLFTQCGTRFIKLRSTVMSKLGIVMHLSNFPTILNFYYISSVYIQWYQEFMEKFITERLEITILQLYFSIKNELQEFLYFTQKIIDIDSEISQIQNMQKISTTIINRLYGMNESSNMVTLFYRVVIQPTYKQIYQWVHQGKLNFNVSDFFITSLELVDEDVDMNKEYSWNNLFSIEAACLPNIFQGSLAEDILKCGKWVYFFEKSFSKEALNGIFQNVPSPLNINSNNHNNIDYCNYHNNNDYCNYHNNNDFNYDSSIKSKLFELVISSNPCFESIKDCSIQLDSADDTNLQILSTRISSLLEYYVKVLLDKINIRKYLEVFGKLWLLCDGVEFEKLFKENIQYLFDYDDLFGEIKISYKLYDEKNISVSNFGVSLLVKHTKMMERRRIFEMKFKIPALAQTVLSHNILSKYQYIFHVISRINLTIFEINLIYKTKFALVDTLNPFNRKLFFVLTKYWNFMQNFFEILLHQYYTTEPLVKSLYQCKSTEDIQHIYAVFLDNLSEKLFITNSENQLSEYSLYSCVIDTAALTECLINKIFNKNPLVSSVFADTIYRFTINYSERDEVFTPESDFHVGGIRDLIIMYNTSIQECSKTVSLCSHSDSRKYLLLMLDEYINTFSSFVL